MRLPAGTSHDFDLRRRRVRLLDVKTSPWAKAHISVGPWRHGWKPRPFKATHQIGVNGESKFACQPAGAARLWLGGTAEGGSPYRLRTIQFQTVSCEQFS
jgi:hypothetical protein